MRVFSNHKFIPLLLVILFFVCSCDTTVECIDPDNWGNPSTTIDSNSSNLTTIITDKAEAIPWTPSYELDGNRVIMIVKNPTNGVIVKNSSDKTATLKCPSSYYSNSSLFDQTNSWAPILSEYLTPYKSIPLCQFPDPVSPYTAWCPCPHSMDSDNVPAINFPCRFNYGLGLYATLATTTPNTVTDFSCKIDGDTKTTYCNNNQISTNCFFHIGDSIKDGLQSSPFYDQSCPTAGISFIPPDSSSTVTMYFKILDRLYHDNAGSYTVEFKQGVRQTGGGIVTKFVGLVQLLLCNVSEGIYKGLVSESDFMGYIRVILLLYVIFLGFSSVMGFSQLTHKELLIKVLKIGLIVQLISPNSWEFFNTYFFNLFTNGIGEITGIIFGQSSDVTPIDVSEPWIKSSKDCNFQTLAGFTAIDDVIGQLFSYETTRKVFSLFFWQIYGFIYIAIIYICLAVVLFVLIRCILIYLVSFLIISILITLAPIFIPFMLFKLTRNFFDKWLKALISYFVQPILVLTFAFFLLQIFVAQMQSMLGYRVCWRELFEINLYLTKLKFYAWQYDFDNRQACIITPNSILYYDTEGTSQPSATKKITSDDELKFVGSLNVANYSDVKLPCGTSSSNNLCTAYTCSQMRYLGYPYLDQTFLPDKPRIKELQKSPPTLVSFKDIVVFAMIIWFMYHFSKMVPSVAGKIASGKISTGKVAGGLGGGIFKFGKKAATLADNAMYYTTGLSARRYLRAKRHTLRGVKERIQDKIGETIETTKQLPAGIAKGLDQSITKKIDSLSGKKKIEQQKLDTVC